MKCNQFEKSTPRHHMSLENLDRALNDLGMLSTITEARREYSRESGTSVFSACAVTKARRAAREYFRESRSRSNLGVMRFNTRYVSNVTVGYCMKRSTNKNRLCPYVLPVRHRTKSENSDATGCEASEESCEHVHSSIEPLTSTCATGDVRSPAKRCQSLENLNLMLDATPKPEVSLDMDCVSTRIQKLQVDE